MENNSYLGSDKPDFAAMSDEKTMAALSHVLTIVFPILAPLIIYLIKKDESKYIAYHAKESLNFQITVMIIIILLCITIIGILLVWFVGIAALVLVIIATIKASEGKFIQIPFCHQVDKMMSESRFCLNFLDQAAGNRYSFRCVALLYIFVYIQQSDHKNKKCMSICGLTIYSIKIVILPAIFFNTGCSFFYESPYFCTPCGCGEIGRRTRLRI